MADGAEFRVTDKGQVYEAAPDKRSGIPHPQALPGSAPRDWETRRPGECAAVVRRVLGSDGHPRHHACCLPIKGDGKYPYCEGHWPFVPPKVTGKDYYKGLRRFIT